MRPKRMMRRSRPVQLGVGALMLAIPASAVALNAGQADTQSAIPIKLNPHRLAFGHSVAVSGTLSPSEAGQPLQLQFAPASGAGWRSLAATRVRGDGSFRFVLALKRSGLVRVVRSVGAPAPQPAQPRAAADSSLSASQRVSVSAKFHVAAKSVDVLGGRPVHVRGKLAPGVGGRHVWLISRTDGGWHTLAGARTGARGGFDLRYSPGSTGRRWLRVRFAGDRLNSGSWAQAGAVTAFPPEPRILVFGWRRHRVWLSRPVRRGEQEPAVWHEGHLPLRRAQRERRCR